MPETDIGNAVASDLTNQMTAYSVASQELEAAGDQKEFTWQNTNWSKYNGYYQTIIAQASNPIIIDAAYKMQAEVMIAMGNYNSAILEYEGILTGEPSLEDSVLAVIKAGRAYILRGNAGGGPGTPQMPWLEPNSLAEYKQNRWQLLCMLDSLNNASIIAGGDITEPASISGMPTEYALHQNHPNPFNPDTEIKYDLRENSKVKLEIYNISGQKVYTLVDGIETAGFKTAIWKSQNSQGERVASGVYIYKLTAEGLQSGEKFVKSMKMTLLQ